MSINSWLPDYQKRVNDSISRYFAKISLDITNTVELEFIDAVRHAVEGGGKRLRPILAMLSYEEITKQECSREYIDAFIAIEFMHCYTLVHDDLPCMDNDVLRRGKPTVWKKYSETMAVLVGDVLQTMAFEEISKLDNAKIVRILAQALGNRGVVLGQVKDTIESQENYTIDDIMRVHDTKTGGFIASCLIIGALAGGVDFEQTDPLRKFGILLGRAFQVRDDILDIEGESAVTGKSVGKDIDQNKGLVAMLGIAETKKILENIKNELETCLSVWNNPKFADIIEYVVKRDN
ncbi:polyprenyl synthetase family protein [Candidatus Gracilibacteria bacterium]|nr:polyprenyl synthetase family protein [Candidatus Gracilibacteria bacterium]